MVGEVAAIRGLLTYLRGDASRAVVLCRHALDRLREDNEVIRGIVAHALGEALSKTGDLDGALQANAQAVRIAKASDSAFLAVTALTALAGTMIEQGMLRQAAERYQEALELATLPNGVALPPAGRVYVCMGKLFYEWNDLDAVTRYAEQGIALCRQGGITEFLTTGYLLRAQVAQAQGDLDAAQAFVDEAQRMVRGRSLPAGAKSWMEACQVHLWLAQGNLERVTRWRQQCGLSVDDPVLYVREAEQCALLHVCLALDQPDPALVLLERLLPAAEDAGRVRRVILCLVLQALAWQAKDGIPLALGALERALTLARPEGYVRTFLDEGEPMGRLLRHAGSRGIEPAYVTRLLSGFAHPGAAAQQPAQPLIEPLSERELEVLRLLSAGKSNREIAAELVLASGTVKRHLYNIYGKMNVQGRLACVARARELDIL